MNIPILNSPDVATDFRHTPTGPVAKIGPFWYSVNGTPEGITDIRMRVTPPIEAATVWVVVSPSAISPRLCLLGEGATKRDAIADAYGPGGKLPRHADCYAVTPEEAQALRDAIND